MNAIDIQGLCKSYGNQQVLHSVDIKIGERKLVGFLGPNGAGKTTTIRILMGLLSKSSGSIKLFDQSVPKNGKAARADIGYLPGDVHQYSNLNGQQLLKFCAKVRKRDCLDEGIRLADAFGLPLDKNIRQFSTGMRQKLGLIQAMMHRPRLLILDEPTSSLDPLVRANVFTELRNVIREGRTVLFSSHSLDEVESLCDEVVILRAGRIVEQQAIEVLQKRALRKVQITFEQPCEASQLPSGFKIFESDGNTITGTWSGEIDALTGWLSKCQVKDLFIERPDLNDLFISYYSEPGKFGKPEEETGA